LGIRDGWDEALILKIQAEIPNGFIAMIKTASAMRNDLYMPTASHLDLQAKTQQVPENHRIPEKTRNASYKNIALLVNRHLCAAREIS
jgi:hypothetical protein